MPDIKLEDVVCVEETSVTIRGYRRRTTVPTGIFKFLNLKQGDSLRWVALKDGNILLSKITYKK
jgi:bifunctional DNA-binding transcriptional regulator/antitoxin component of YhaV-PrlF toxin-antitoxin module